MPRVRTHTPTPSKPAATTGKPAKPTAPKNTTPAKTTGTRDVFSPVPPPPPRTTGKATTLDAASRIFLSPTGELLSGASSRPAKTVVQQGETIYRASQLANARNLFADPAITLEQKSGALLSLAAAFNGANPTLGLPNGFTTRDQALQVRAAAAPLILDIARSLDPARPAEKALQQKAIGEYLKLLDTEPHGLARTFMIYDLQRAKPGLPAEFRPRIDELMNEVAPLAPPYEQWFKDGNTALNVDYYVGDGFWEEELGKYTSRGFERTDNPDGTVTLKRHYSVDAPLGDGTPRKYETDVVMTMHNGPERMFQNMQDPTVGIVVYSGHANYGREVPSHLPEGSAMQGGKVFFAMQCGGKGVHNALLEKYPDLQVVASKNSSYGYQDQATMLNAFDGIAARAPWVRISERNVDSNSSNYYFPTDTLISRRTQDLDRDGRVDEWDRVVDYDTFHPQADVAEQLTPRDPKQPAAELDGRDVHGAVLRFHRMAGYNEWCEPLKDQGVLNDGFFDGKPTDPLYKLEKVEGEDVFRLRVNKCYAHANEQTMGAVLHYELGRRFAEESGLKPADAKAAGLLMAAKALDVDVGWDEREIWPALLAYAKLPATIRYDDAMAANHENETYSAGCPGTLESFQKALEAQAIKIE